MKAASCFETSCIQVICKINFPSFFWVISQTYTSVHVGPQNTEKWLTSLSVKLSWTLRVKEVSGTLNSGASWLGSYNINKKIHDYMIIYMYYMHYNPNEYNTLYCGKMQCKLEDRSADIPLILTICRELERSCIKSSIVFSIGPLHKMWGNLNNVI